MRHVIRKVRESWVFNIFMASVLLVSGVVEIQADFRELEEQTLHAGHGVLAIALWHLLQGLEAALESVDYAKKLDAPQEPKAPR